MSIVAFDCGYGKYIGCYMGNNKLVDACITFGNNYKSQIGEIDIVLHFSNTLNCE